MVLFDSHAHLDDEKFAPDLDDVIARARAVGVEHILTVGAHPALWDRTVMIAERYPGVLAAVGCHAHDAKDFSPEIEARIRGYAAAGKLAAIGEMGLDYYYDRSPRDKQREVLAHQLGMVVEIGLPVILHLRDSIPDALAILRDFRNSGLRGVAHCFGGDAAAALALVEMGFFISFAGTLTFPKTDDLKAAAKAVPADRLLVETDCPFLAPQPVRGKRNEPAFVRHTLYELAALRGLSADEAAALTTANAKRLFGVTS